MRLMRGRGRETEGRIEEDHEKRTKGASEDQVEYEKTVASQNEEEDEA